ncbi:MAG: ion transporter [Sedimentisphaerales bacterium]|nr:ion transporter [Sedimentisphaerales bacterium]
MSEIVGKDGQRGWRDVLYEVIFEADTAAGKWFDIILILCIVLSVAVVMLDSVGSVNAEHGRLLKAAEWFFTILFTIEYILRLVCVRMAVRYAVSFFGIVDLLAILPAYISLLVPGRYLAVVRVVRVLRVLRIFRVLNMGQHAREAVLLKQALYASRRKIEVFLLAVLTLVVIIGSLMYVVEGGKNGFTSIPVSVYWAVVTLTTVGYGDISPTTAIGQFLAALVMILGYSIIVVPTGLVTVEISKASVERSSSQACPNCSAEGHDRDAEYCKACGSKL